MDKKVFFYISSPHDCNYVKDKKASTLFVKSPLKECKDIYNTLIKKGFRRSGRHIYKPNCSNCHECIPVRIPANEFEFKKNHKRNIRKNKDLRVKCIHACFKEEHFQLYKKYLSFRHYNAGMDNPTKNSYIDFLWANWSDTMFFEFYLNKKLISIAVVDILDSSFSAVYTFFDPEYENFSLGKYAILYLIKQCQINKLSWLYLGYWNPICNKMKYKIDYKPIECLIENKWKKFNDFSKNHFSDNQN